MRDAKTTVKKKKMGVGAVFGSLKRYIHSQKDDDAKYPNATQRDRLEVLIVVDQGVIMVHHKDQVCIFFDTMTSLTNAFVVSNDVQRL